VSGRSSLAWDLCPNVNAKTINVVRNTVAVRLEGGLGDHVLGMRVLPFIKMRYPIHDIIIYSDSAGHSTQLEVAAMSPFVGKVVPVYASPANRDVVGELQNIRPSDLALMFSAQMFIDAWGGDMFTKAASALQVPVFDILGCRSVLSISANAAAEANRLLATYDGGIFVGLNLLKYGADMLRRHEARVVRLLEAVLARPNVIVLNMCTSSYRFPHWPEPERTVRYERSKEEFRYVESLCTMSSRIVPCLDMPVAIIAALLKRCRYFIGVDNGLKHLAWALNVPRTFFSAQVPRVLGTLRWMPDVHRLLLFESPDWVLDGHIADAIKSIGDQVRGA
jgi:hypothetical protein